MSDAIDRSLIEAARPGLEPTPDDRARVRRGVAAAIAAGAAVGGSAAGASAAVPAAVSGTKIAIVAVVAIAAIGGGAALLVNATSHDERAPVAEHRPAIRAPQREEIPSEIAPSEPTAEPAPVAVQIEEQVAPAPPAPRPRAQPIDSMSTETELLAAATQSLRAGDPAAALARLNEHQRRFPRGVLREERLATRVLALCAAGRTDDARAEAARFLEQFPQSMLGRRVRASCAAP